MAARPKPSLVDGKAKHVGLGHQGRQRVVVDRTEHERFDAARRAGRVERGPVVAVVEQRLAAGDHEADPAAPVAPTQAHGLDQVEGALAGLDAADGEHDRVRADAPPATAARAATASPAADAARSNRSASTPFGITVAAMPHPGPQLGRPPPRDTHTWATGVTMARSWQRASSGVVKWSRWWTVRHAAPGTALAEMQSWAWTTS